MHDEDEHPDIESRISKSQRKRDALDLQKLGEELLLLKEEQLQRLGLPAILQDAIHAAQKIHQRGGRKRQLQYIGKLMRQTDAEPIRQALADLHTEQQMQTARFHQLEQWRDRLLAGDDTALDEIFTQLPDADRQHLLQLVRNARKPSKNDAPDVRTARILFRYLRELSGPA